MPFDLDNYMRIAMGRESSGNPNARNPKSSASGQFQFIDPTYMAYARKMNPGVSEGALMAKKNDPQMQNAVMRAFTQDNVNTLQNAGIDPNNGSAYAAHFLGPQGALRALKADPNTPIDQVVDPQALAANPGVFGNIKTAGDFAKWTNQYDGDAPQQTAQADLPAPGASEAQFQAPQAPDKSVWERVAAGDTSALYGPDMGDTLSNVGIAMMARDNPTGAAAMASALRYSKDGKTKTAKKDKQVVKYDPKTGQAAVYDPNTETWATKKVTEPAAPEANAQIIKQFQGNNDAAEASYNTLEKMNKYRELIADGQIDLGFVSKMDKDYRLLANQNLTPQQRNAVNFVADMEDLRNTRLLEAKGVQTEGDAQRAMQAILPGMSNLNNQAALSLLDRATGDLGKAYQKHSSYTDALVKKYGDLTDPDVYNSTREQRTKYTGDFEKNFAPKRDAFFKSGQAQSEQAAQGITGGTQRTQPGGSSLADRIRNDPDLRKRQ